MKSFEGIMQMLQKEFGDILDKSQVRRASMRRPNMLNTVNKRLTVLSTFDVAKADPGKRRLSIVSPPRARINL